MDIVVALWYVGGDGIENCKGGNNDSTIRYSFHSGDACIRFQFTDVGDIGCR